MTKPNLLKELYDKQNQLKTAVSSLKLSEKENNNLLTKINDAREILSVLRDLVKGKSIWSILRKHKTIIKLVKEIIEIF
tara:strand:- start:910 stop:1146 length:237 start_codon:yes stop_codon:yes gene_type:complete